MNKGDDKNPNYRSRLEAKEFKRLGLDDDDLFAGTPPLEALKLLISAAATTDDVGNNDRCMLIADVSRAFFEAAATRDVCVEIVEEDRTPEDDRLDLVGKLELSMYGTRDAPANWQEEIAKNMKSWQFSRGLYNSWTYRHRDRDLQVLVHGDDFVAVGSLDGVTWFKDMLEGRFKIKCHVLGSKPGLEKEGRILNRIIRVTDDGWEYEADQRHAELIVEALGLNDCKSVKTPGEDLQPCEAEDNAKELSEGDATGFRKVAARANYLAMDRPDIQYPVKELCRGMCKPTIGHKKKLKRLGRYLRGRPRVVFKYDWQEKQDDLTVFTDSDWAGCKITARSTTGGVIALGHHIVKTWSRTQKTIALSSAEAELTAMVKGTCEGLGVSSLMEDWDQKKYLVMMGDSTAALGVIRRKGAGKLRHVNIGMLWVQEKRDGGEVEYRKVGGKENPADLMTKYLTGIMLDAHAGRLCLRFRSGRAEKASLVTKDA